MSWDNTKGELEEMKTHFHPRRRDKWHLSDTQTEWLCRSIVRRAEEKVLNESRDKAYGVSSYKH